MVSQRAKRNPKIILGTCGIGIYIIMLYFPIYWMIQMSFKKAIDISLVTPKWIFEPILSNYLQVLDNPELVKGLWRSFVVAFSNTVIACLLGIPAAYVLARIRFAGRSHVEFWILTTRMLPPVAILIPYVGIWVFLGLLDTLVAFSITHLVINLPLVIWLSVRFIEQIPPEIEEAAFLDGCSRTSALARIILPLAAPGFIVAALFAFIFSWNEFFFMFVLSAEKRTISVVLASFLMQGHEIMWGQLSASAVIASLPALVIVLLLRGFIVQGFKFLGRG